jgi:hypothetical protein
MIRMIDGQPIETRELMTECAQHGGNWIVPADEVADGFCIIQDVSEYANYLEHVRVPEKEEEADVIDVADARLQALAEAEEAEAKRGLAYVGLAPDAPVEQNEQGGLQSVVEGRFDLIPPIAAFELAKVMQHGAEKYSPRNWEKIPVESHLNHLLMHVFAYLAGDRQEEHLTHALARAAMAVEKEKLNAA